MHYKQERKHKKPGQVLEVNEMKVLKKQNKKPTNQRGIQPING